MTSVFTVLPAAIQELRVEEKGGPVAPIDDVQPGDLRGVCLRHNQIGAGTGDEPDGGPVRARGPKASGPPRKGCDDDG